MKKLWLKKGSPYILLIILFAFLFVNERYVKTKDLFFYNLLLALINSALVSILFSLFSDAKLRDELNEVSQKSFSVLKDCQDARLYMISYQGFPLEDPKIHDDFIDSKKLVIVMNDAKAFISSHIPLLQERLSQSGKETTFIIQDYKQTDIMDVLTRKNGHDKTPDYYKEKIKDVIDYHIQTQLQNFAHKKHNLSYLLNPNYNTVATILMDHYAMESIYRNAAGKSEVPHFVYEKDGREYNHIRTDVEKLESNIKSR